MRRRKTAQLEDLRHRIGIVTSGGPNTLLMQRYIGILQQRYVRLLRDQSFTTTAARQECFPTASAFLRYYHDRTASQSLVHPIPDEVLLSGESTSDDPVVHETVFRNHFTNPFSSDYSVDSLRLQECPPILDEPPSFPTATLHR